ncbi:MAG: nucleotidyltransferase domain-containing protein [Candidatus Margulisbacteria bacterium]|nr:nucleotidyltransferase domain-containing protein [Candidatus Margulisiibacteriota bacterium]
MNEQEIQKEIESITNQIVGRYKPQKILLFGSAAWGKITKDSDLDFLIIKDDVPFYGIDRMRELDHMIDYSIPVDFLVYKPEEFEERLAMGDPFLSMINKRGKILYGGPENN